MSRLLAISWALPPILKPRSLQVARLLKGLSELGWEIDVITVDPQTSITARPLDTLLEKHYQGAFTVHRAKSSYRQLLYILLGKLWPALNPIPDTEIPWRKAAAKLGQRLVKQNHYDALISFGQPWSSHLVAQSIHTATELPWLAHFSDPWADNPYYTRLNAKQKARMLLHEGQVIQQADSIVFTNTQTYDKVMSKYPSAWAQKAAVVPHSYDASLLPSATAPAAKTGVLTMCYAGHLYGLRTPENLIRAVARSEHAAEIRIRIAGIVKNQARYQDLARELGVEHSFEFLGQLDYQSSLGILNASHVLILIDAPSSVSLFLPSKLIDYLMFNKPILGITPKNGASADVLARLECPVAAPDDVDEITAQLDTLVGLWRQGRLRLPEGAHQVAAEFSSQAIARQFDRVLQTSINQRASV